MYWYFAPSFLLQDRLRIDSGAVSAVVEDVVLVLVLDLLSVLAVLALDRFLVKVSIVLTCELLCFPCDLDLRQ